MNKKQKNKIRSLKEKNSGFIELLRKRDKRIKVLEYEVESAYNAVHQIENLYCAYLVSLCKKRGGILRFKRCEVENILKEFKIKAHHDEEFVYIELEKKNENS